MWIIESFVGYDRSIKVPSEDWDDAMSRLSETLSRYFDKNLIDSGQFERAMEWATGVVIEDTGVTVPFEDDRLTVSITLTD